jgi:type I restriction enzyme S subunit
MSREMKHSGVAWIGEIPKHWEVVRNKNAFSNSKTIVGENWNNTQLLSLTTKGIKAIDIGSTSGKVPDSYETYQVVGKDNLVMCLFDLDCSAVFSGLSQIEGMISPAYKVLTVQNGFLPAFYDKWFNYIFDGRKFMFLSKNIRYSLTYDEFASLQIVKPPIEEQQKIAEFLDRKCGEIDEMISLQEKVIEELKAYKQSIITEAVTKGLNPNVAMRDSEIEWIGEIPEHWEVHPFKAYYKTTKGLNITKENLVESGVPVISYGQIHSKLNMGTSISNELIRYVPETYLDSNPECLSKKFDMFFADTSEDREGAGNVAFIDIDTPIFAGYHTIIARPNDEIKTKYFAYLTKTDAWRTQIRNSVSGVKVFSISQKLINRAYIIIPSPIEQQAIADYLDSKCAEIDELVAVKQQKIETLKEYKKSLIYEYVTGKKEI